MCRVLEVTHSGYYAWLKGPQSRRAIENARLLKLIRASFNASHGIYGSDGWQRFCRTNRLVPSMSRRGNCWDNAVAESFFSSLKKEHIKKKIYKNRAIARGEIAEYIEAFYNPRRRHTHLGGVSPEVLSLRDHGTEASTKSWEVQTSVPLMISGHFFNTVSVSLLAPQLTADL
jgi:transposase InsO family protein